MKDEKDTSPKTKKSFSFTFEDEENEDNPTISQTFSKAPLKKSSVSKIQEYTFEFENENPEDTEAILLMAEGEERELKVRLDKWLWAARFFKTRALARLAVEAGKVFYNGQRSKPSLEIELGASLQIRQGDFEKMVIIKGLSTRRRSVEDAAQLFEETPESRRIREQRPLRTPRDFTPYEQQQGAERPRKVVRFLRRSFGRQETTTPSVPVFEPHTWED